MEAVKHELSYTFTVSAGFTESSNTLGGKRLKPFQDIMEFLALF
jgi:hypothetical protein